MDDCALEEVLVSSTDEQTSAVDRNGRMRSLLDSHFVFIWRLLRRFGVPENDVDDAAQQVFIVAWNKLDEVPESTERSFLFGTALRVAASFRRRLRRRGEIDSEVLARRPDENPRADEVLAGRQRAAFIGRIIAAMDDELRAVFVLCQIEELTVAEAAALQRIPVGTAASRLRRARKNVEQRAKRVDDRLHCAEWRHTKTA
jgi:RNA polymerase sigma-70 factor (ECF subfamily)